MVTEPAKFKTSILVNCADRIPVIGSSAKQPNVYRAFGFSDYDASWLPTFPRGRANYSGVDFASVLNYFRRSQNKR